MVKPSEIELPVTFKRHLLFKSGNWNGWDIKPEEVNKSVSNTKWNKINSSLIYSHKDNEAEAWVGNVKNIIPENGAVYGDLEIWDPDTALKAKYGGAAYAVSAGIAWPDRFEQPTNFFYRNFSLVTNPGVIEKDIFLNFSAKENVGGYKTAIFSSSLNDISESDNTQKEIVTEQITPLENDIPSEEKQNEEKKEINEPVKIDTSDVKQIQENLEPTLQEDNIIERGLKKESSMENEKEVQINETVVEQKEIKNETQPIVNEKIVQESQIISPELDEKAIDSIVEKLVGKINIQSSPAPVTTQEFGSGIVNSEDAVVDRLVTDLLKN